MNNKKANKNHTSHLALHTSNNNKCKKFVGAYCIRPNSRGITLIALIITIIVMLILIAVTITVALDTGLFGTAKKGAYQTEVSTIKEQLEIAKVAKVAENGGEEPTNYELTINDLNIEEKLKNKYGNKLIISEDGTLYYKGDVVTSEEERSWLEEIGINKQDETLSLLKDYFLGKEDEHGNRPGKNLEELVDQGADLTNIKFKDDLNTPEDESNINVLSLGQYRADAEDENLYLFQVYYIEYNNKAYALTVKYNNTVPSEGGKTISLEYKYTPSGREGEKIDIDLNGDGEISENEKDWTILYDYGNGIVEAVSSEAIGSLTLGTGDTTINWEDENVKNEANIDGEEGLTDIEKAIYSYNHAIETINNYCKEQFADEIIPDENVRSVGAKIDPRPNLEGDNVVREIPEELSNDVANKYNGKLKAGDTEYEQDIIRISYFKLANDWKESNSWVASRCVNIYSEFFSFNIVMSYIDPNGLSVSYGFEPMSSLLSYDESIGRVFPNDISNAVRPVIKVKIP